MSGSKRWFRYVDDNGSSYAVNRDESNTELVNEAAANSASVASLLPLPQGIKARYITLSNVSGEITRNCTILTPERYSAINNSVNFLLTAANFSGVAVDTTTTVVTKTPEIARRQPRIGDTGLNDGDNE